ncbi:AlbA family DNA-binding domain-containing protein [Streptomyces sasae]|uniref:AlbA family DNA-binding domain-containing protein n=1 Tax=Streptomyces sasae TaxID=1266772 RepID=UPI00292FD770|nr:ATP-binding protein [Streptomyces sasae]
MTAHHSPRLEGIFGDRLDAVTHEQVASLKANSVTEDYDLDLKAELYGRSDKARRDLAGDVSALANTAGGVLVLGIDEDDQARAVGLPGVDLSDSEGRRYRQIVADLVHPQPEFEIVTLEDPQQEGHGFLLIVVPRSPLAPHAVHVDVGLRYPKRYGTTTTYLSEAQVALAYRERFAGFQRGFEDLKRHEADLVSRLNGTHQAFVLVDPGYDVLGGSRG